MSPQEVRHSMSLESVYGNGGNGIYTFAGSIGGLLSEISKKREE